MKLYFAQDSTSAPYDENRYSKIRPVDTGWNDFGFSFQAVADVVVPGKPGIQLRMFVVPWNRGLLSNKVSGWLVKSLKVTPGTAHLAIGEGHRFFSILRADGYERIVEWAGEDRKLLEDVLSLFHDIVFFRWKGRSSDSIKEFLASDAAILGVFRDETAYLNYHRAWRILAGARVDATDARGNFEFECNLPGYSGVHKAAFKFAVPQPLSDRCHAIIGENGVGKTRFLKELVVSLGALSGVSREILCGEAKAMGKLRYESHDAAIGRVVVLSWGVGANYPEETPITNGFEYTHYSIADLGSLGGSRRRDNELSMLAQIIRDPRTERGSSRLQLFEKAVSSCLSLKEIAVCLLSGKERRWVSIASLIAGSEQDRLDKIGRIDPSGSLKYWHGNGVAPFSSGQSAMLSFAVRAVCSITPGTLLILDEPEIHLHPSMVAALMKALHELLEEAESIALIATHSPFVARELPTSCVHVLRCDSQRVPAFSTPYLRTLGASVDNLSIDVFNDAGVHKFYHETASKISMISSSMEEVIERFGQQISVEMLSLVRSYMEKKNAIS
ncbi:AAA family ATPase [Stenotrophomonas sp. PA-6-5C]|uniref:AAA family ATPase n=1 Tax=Stenotrophomonas sp. PA-6-5C TaxID=2665487 RepID=UPI001F1E1529|nr:AAA family ATPase [Stenotrophomonas sp. PA-6-5C]MCF5091005.1 AAA family ATPase [Stenotrophomonas sp. PA-6-5C]